MRSLWSRNRPEVPEYERGRGRMASGIGKVEKAGMSVSSVRKRQRGCWVGERFAIIPGMGIERYESWQRASGCRMTSGVMRAIS
jgi:hypothetical protein